MKKIIAGLGLQVIISTAYGQVFPKVRQQVEPPADKHKFLLFLQAGQSNMAGRGKVEPEDTLANNHILLLNKQGKWEIAKEPVHDDGTLSGLGPGLAFGKAMLAADTSLYIGLIPCAASGSAINTWLPPTDTASAGKNQNSNSFRAINRRVMESRRNRLHGRRRKNLRTKVDSGNKRVP